jgi:hypothetical protein
MNIFRFAGGDSQKSVAVIGKGKSALSQYFSGFGEKGKVGSPLGIRGAGERERKNL